MPRGQKRNEKSVHQGVPLRNVFRRVLLNDSFPLYVRVFFAEFRFAVPDKALHGFFRHLEVELEPDGVLVAESLILAGGAFGQAFRALGQVECFPVPVESHEAHRKIRNLSGYRMPADFLAARIFEYLRSEGARHDLCAEAYSERGLAFQYVFAREFLFRGEPRVLLLIVHAHRAAHEYGEVDVIRGRNACAVEKGNALGLPLHTAERVRAGSFGFKRDVLKNSDAHIELRNDFAQNVVTDSRNGFDAGAAFYLLSVPWKILRCNAFQFCSLPLRSPVCARRKRPCSAWAESEAGARKHSCGAA